MIAAVIGRDHSQLFTAPHTSQCESAVLIGRRYCSILRLVDGLTYNNLISVKTNSVKNSIVSIFLPFQPFIYTLFKTSVTGVMSIPRQTPALTIYSRGGLPTPVTFAFRFTFLVGHFSALSTKVMVSEVSRYFGTKILVFGLWNIA